MINSFLNSSFDIWASQIPACESPTADDLQRPSRYQSPDRPTAILFPKVIKHRKVQTVFYRHKLTTTGTAAPVVRLRGAEPWGGSTTDGVIPLAWEYPRQPQEELNDGNTAVSTDTRQPTYQKLVGISLWHSDRSMVIMMARYFTESHLTTATYCTTQM